MRYQLESCAMPGCKTSTERGKRLCKKHASTGKDMRIPKFVLSVGLSKIYSIMQLNKTSFSVEDIMLAIDPYYAEHPDAVNNTNAMAKLFRTLRTNHYIVKKGYRDGFVVYDLGQGWDKSNVTIEDENSKPEKNIKIENGRINISDREGRLGRQEKRNTEEKLQNTAKIEKNTKSTNFASLEKKIECLSSEFAKKDKMLNEALDKTIKAQKETINQLNAELSELKKQYTAMYHKVTEWQERVRVELAKLQEKTNNQFNAQFAGLREDLVTMSHRITELQEQVSSGNSKTCDCPVAKLREQMGVFFGGKKVERPK